MAIELSRQETTEIRTALADLNAAFAYHLDHGELEALVDLFSEDALYTHGERRSEGRQEIETLFRRRTAAGPRTSRHIYSGLRVEIDSHELARGSSVCLSFAADGLPPLPATPFLVADFIDVYILSADKKWRIRERHINRVFVNET